ncbi:MAG: polysaccharide biosynthesis/export family protein [Caulobacteraceae bacterium]
MASPGLITACLALIVPLAGCASGAHQSDTVLTVADPTPDTPKDYVIGPLDKLSIKVFQVQDLSLDAVQVDASGQIVLPLIGNVTASGKTTNQLSQEIAGRLGERYLQSPQVSVIVLQSTSQKVTVEGEVRSPGVFQMAGTDHADGGPGDGRRHVRHRKPPPCRRHPHRGRQAQGADMRLRHHPQRARPGLSDPGQRRRSRGRLERKSGLEELVEGSAARHAARLRALISRRLVAPIA